MNKEIKQFCLDTNENGTGKTIQSHGLSLEMQAAIEAHRATIDYVNRHKLDEKKPPIPQEGIVYENK